MEKLYGKRPNGESGNLSKGNVDSRKACNQSGASFKKSVIHLGGNPYNPFEIFNEVKELYAEVLEDKTMPLKTGKSKSMNWAVENPEAAQEAQIFLAGSVPEIDSDCAQKENDASKCIGSAGVPFSGKIPNIIVSSADLSNSDKTDGYFKNSKPLEKGDFSGCFSAGRGF